MSDEPIIQVEGLGKRYSLRHNRPERYTTLRDVIADKAKRLFRPNGGGSKLQTPGSERPSKEDFWALRNVSFEVRQGEVVGIIGRNGAGKSTLLKMLNGIIRPDLGTIRMKGRIGALIEVGAGFHPMLTGRENIELNGLLLGLTKSEIGQREADIIEFAELGDHARSLGFAHVEAGPLVRSSYHARRAHDAAAEPDATAAVGA